MHDRLRLLHILSRFHAPSRIPALSPFRTYSQNESRERVLSLRRSCDSAVREVQGGLLLSGSLSSRAFSLPPCEELKLNLLLYQLWPSHKLICGTEPVPFHQLPVCREESDFFAKTLQSVFFLAPFWKHDLTPEAVTNKLAEIFGIELPSGPTGTIVQTILSQFPEELNPLEVRRS